MLIKVKASREPRAPMPTTTRVDLKGEVTPSLSQTIQQPALAREVATRIAADVLGDRQHTILQTLDYLRKTRASRGGVGEPLRTIEGTSEYPELYDENGYRISEFGRAGREE